MQNIKNFIRVFLLVISISCVANAYLVPGQPGGGGQVGPYPGGPGGGHIGDGGGQGGGGLVPGQPGRPPRPPSPPYPGNPYPGDPYPGDPYPGNPYPGDPGYPNDPYPGNPGQPGYDSEVKRIYINRNIVNETLPLRQLAGIGRQYDSWEVVSVRARVQTTNPGRTVAQLVSDGRVVATQINPNYQIELMPQYRLILGQSANNLQLGIGGGIFIETIEVELRRDGGGYNPPPPGYGQNIEINIYRSVMGNDRIDLTQYIDMNRYRGRVIEQVLVTATARYNAAFINLLINSFDMGRAQFSGGYSQIATFWMNQQMVIGQGADSIVLYTQGDMNVDHVTLVIR